jgi:hypothetical protein
LTVAITERLKLDVSLTTNDDVPIAGSANLRGFVDGKWEPLVRYDSAHGHQHRDVMHPFGAKDVHPFVAILIETFIEAARTDLLSNAEKYLEDFEQELAAGTGDRYDDDDDDEQEH